jgi:FKBP-type peptidyl-prolyl cis-trans isomerase 2
MTIEKNMVVSFRYIMSDGKGTVLEDTTSCIPTRYLYGSTAIYHALQEQMEGLQPGDSRKIMLLESAGLTNSDYFFEVIIDAVRPAKDHELILGYPLGEEDASCGNDCDCFKNLQ